MDEAQKTPQDVLLEDLEDEYNGTLHYIELAEKNPQYQDIYLVMANQEYEHADTLEEIAKDMNICTCDNEDLNTLRKEVEQAYNS